MNLHIESIGSGPDIVLLHGWAMHSGMWRDVSDHLAQHFRLHLVDLPGHGFSRNASPARVSASQSDTLEGMAEILADVLPASFIVCGWSLGGQVAIELALRAPLRVRKLALISTTPCFVRRKDWQWGMEAATLQLFTENLKRDYSVTMKRFLTLQISGGGSGTASALAQLRKSLFERDKPDDTALEAGLQILLSSDLRDRIRNITQPVLLFHGENDVITHPDAARWMNRQLQNSELIMLPGCGHAPFLSYPEQFVAGMLRLAYPVAGTH
ncbi:pimeloyl-ACP methyl ester esterase BioH [Nitrosospira sp. Nsp1]|uniref:pimeloyl-ACP methyl ester esterase BioH n=1 Tax=Nitrosospira sp. Nsp1 TaxID=136547 RepID=UPI0008819D61|nr:pimeloyl-ACP methyl ester esterase BioH [Nitrosospira sp. Nsp1]SCX52901.1 carboxylesterase BioH (pimeloyl-CoA synthesis) [Nitrosospira sp. Nsp1]